MSIGESPRYALLPLFVAGVFFVVLSPMFWLSTELPEGKRGKHIARGHENLALYERVYPSMAYGFGRLRAGELPLWNPRQLCGTPFLADPLNGMFQPLNLVFLLPGTERAMAVHAFLGLFLMGALFTLFARSLGTGYAPAAIGGVVYAFSGASAAAMSRPELLNTLAWTPLLFWSLREHARRGGAGTVATGGFALAFMLLSGSVAMSTAMGLLAAAYGLVRVTTGSPDVDTPLMRRLGGLAVILLLGAGVAALQWAPALAWLTTLHDPWAALWRFDIAGQRPGSLGGLMVQALSAEPAALPRLAYVGAVPLVVALAALFHRPGWLEAAFFLAAASVLFPLSLLGSTAGLPWEALTYPAVFSIAAASALGADRLLVTGRDPRSPLVWLPALMALMAAGGLLYAAPYEVKGRVLALVGALLPLILFRVRGIGAACGVAVAALLYIDLSWANANYYQHPYADAPACYARSGADLGAAEEQAVGGRLLLSTPPLGEVLAANTGMVSGLRLAGGARIPLLRGPAAWWSALEAPGAETDRVRAVQPFPGAARPALLNVMAVKSIAAAENAPLAGGSFEQGGPRLRPVRGGKVSVFANDAALPRALRVETWRAAADTRAAMEILGEASFDPARICTVTASGAAFEQLLAIVPDRDAGPGETLPPACAIAVDQPERVVVETTGQRPGIVVLADTHAPGWRALVNGAPAPILAANGIFRGVAVPAGTHTVEFVYRPLSLWAGAAISLITLAWLAGRGFLALARAR